MKYIARIIRVIDADTFVANIYLGFNLTIKEHLRLLNVDAHEMHGGTDIQRQMAQQEKAYAYSLLTSSVVDCLTIGTHKDDSFGRWLADVYIHTSDGLIYNLSTMLKEFMTKLASKYKV